MLQESFERFFATESSASRVRSAEPSGFDKDLWQKLLELGAPSLRVAADRGGGGLGAFEATLLMQEAGRRIAAAPLAEAIVALRLLSVLEGQAAQTWLARALQGEVVVTLALHELRPGEPQIVPGAAAADGLLDLHGEDVCLAELRSSAGIRNLGDAPLQAIRLEDCKTTVLVARGQAARAEYLSAIEEWKLLNAAALVGLAREALAQAARYAAERSQFDQPIGAYQAISHPLADAIIEADGAELLLWRTLRAIADNEIDAGAKISLSYWWAARTASNAVARALHTFGGYGLTLEYDIQLYHRRAKGWALAFGDPSDELERAGRRMWGGEAVALPDVGVVEIDFDLGEEAAALAEETRAFFEATLTPALREKAHFSFEGLDWGVNKKLGAARLLHPDWPEQWGGRDASHYATVASGAVWEEFLWGAHARGVNAMVGRIVMMFGAPELQRDVLARIAGGEIITSLGYSEPGSGSDVFAAKTRAVRDGEDWVINGQKMFTSGADLASYVLLLTRTDPDAPKHRGLTLFLVPLDAPGVEIHPIHTFQDERTNVTFYSNVRVCDGLRIGEVHQGVRVMSAALAMEQGGGGYFHQQRNMLKEALAWARQGDGARLSRRDVLCRLAQVAAHADISEVLAKRALFTCRREDRRCCVRPRRQGIFDRDLHPGRNRPIGSDRAVLASACEARRRVHRAILQDTQQPRRSMPAPVRCCAAWSQNDGSVCREAEIEVKHDRRSAGD